MKSLMTAFSNLRLTLLCVKQSTFNLKTSTRNMHTTLNWSTASWFNLPVSLLSNLKSELLILNGYVSAYRVTRILKKAMCTHEALAPPPMMTNLGIIACDGQQDFVHRRSSRLVHERNHLGYPANEHPVGDIVSLYSAQCQYKCKWLQCIKYISTHTHKKQTFFRNASKLSGYCSTIWSSLGNCWVAD